MADARITSIDTVRGVAVLGILVMNIIGMAFAGAAYLNPTYTGGADPLNIALWAGAAVAVDGKMRALFAMLFGASMLLMSQGAPAGQATARHIARMLVLMLFGLVHGFFWSGDILLPYALVGLVVWPLRGLPVRRLFLFGVLALALQAAITLMFGAQAMMAEAAASAPGASAASREMWDELRSVTWTAPDELARALALNRGSLADLLTIRAEENLFARFFLLPFVFFAETVGLMLVGMALFRLGWWQGDWPDRHYRRMAAWLIPLGLVLGAVIVSRFQASGFAPAPFYFMDAARVFVAPALAIGYAAAIIALVRSGACRAAVSRLAACGRMALSNYLLASLIANILFTGLGFGLYGELSRIEAYGIVLLVWALQLAWSRPWLEHFRYGPFEWLWRSLARWQRQPMQPPAYP